MQLKYATERKHRAGADQVLVCSGGKVSGTVQVFNDVVNTFYICRVMTAYRRVGKINMLRHAGRHRRENAVQRNSDKTSDANLRCHKTVLQAETMAFIKPHNIRINTTIVFH